MNYRKEDFGDLKVLSNRQIAPGYYHMVIRSKKIAQEAQPGQFVQIRASAYRAGISLTEDANYQSGYTEPFFRRPISIFRANPSDQTFEIIYKVVGKGSYFLSLIKANSAIDLIGPLGRWFMLTPGPLIKRKITMVSGGVGMPPLYFLAEKAIAQGYEVDWIMGSATAATLLYEEQLRKLNINLRVATDDGSAGFKGFVTDLLDQYLSSVEVKPSEIFTCGPHVMMEKVAMSAKKAGIPCQASLEEMMSCGFGICVGCVFRTPEGEYHKSCVEGPCVSTDHVDWGGFRRMPL